MKKRRYLKDWEAVTLIAIMFACLGFVCGTVAIFGNTIITIITIICIIIIIIISYILLTRCKTFIEE